MPRVVVSAAAVFAAVCLFACPVAAAPIAQGDLHPAVRQALEEALSLSYDELFESAAGYEFNAVQLARMRAELQDAEKICVKGFKKRAKTLDRRLRDAQSELRRKTAKLDDKQREELHCTIQNRRLERDQAAMFAEHAVPLAYDNKQAKLDLIEQWPGELRRIRADKASGVYRSREFADVEDIGFREIQPNQEKDIKRGKQAQDEMRQMGMMPKELEDERIVRYVEQLAQRVAAKSDLHVPLKITVLDTPEINAFALPGGFLYINRGLIEAAEDEAQLAGVIAHETAHVAARHSHRLIQKARIASILYQAAQLGTIIATGGVYGIGAYYAMQYGFFGLGLALNLQLLGVSREYELEADQLGVQYAWNAGYDPSGFIRFFDKMAHKEGYVRGASWFRTHPPFYERMVRTQREIEFLPAKDSMIVQTNDFIDLEAHVKLCAEQSDLEARREEECKPTLLGKPETECPRPDLIEFESGDPIEGVCAAVR